jgi:Ca-activated chloride channel family protein
MKASKIIFITICIIGIVLVLLAFLMPSLQRVRHQSRNVAEQSKIKQQVLQERIAKESVQNTPGAEDYASNQETATKPNKKSLTEVRAILSDIDGSKPYSSDGKPDPMVINGDPKEVEDLVKRIKDRYSISSSGTGAAGGMMDGHGGMGGMSLGGGYGGGRGSSSNGRETSPVPTLQKIPLSGRLFTNRTGSPSQEQLRNQLLSFSADELWIIAKVDTPRRIVSDDTPGTGAMLAKLPKQEKEIPLPLKHTDVKGDICGYIATVEVTQQFQNPYGEKIEAVYVFPLPDNAAVNEFIMIIGDRKIRGIIRERQEAEQIYQQARDQGYTASLLTQERPNIFTQKVANIEPNKQIDVNIKYFSTLAYVDGWYEFVFPMVVGPRYNPPGSTDGVGAVAHGRAGISGQDTEVQYLKPNERSGHDISLAVNIDAGVEIEEIKCPSHVIKKSTLKDEILSVKLSELDSIPNKDFVLRYKVAGDKVKSAMVTHQDKRGGYFTLMLYPPENLSNVKRAPMEMIFVLDTSGSMSGKPIEKAKDAVSRALRQLQPGDTFQIIRFANETTQLGPQPIPATAENIRRGLEYVQNLSGAGGTEMIEGVRAALNFAHDPERFRLVSFMTDGYIGNEDDILEAVHDKLGESRIFSFGVGTSVNRYLLDRMACLGKGAVAYIGLDEEAGEIIDSFYERISHPALTNVAIDWGSLDVTEVYPNKIPDLFVGRPIIVTGRFKGNRDTTIRVHGNVGKINEDIAIAVNLDDSASTHPGIACVWARKQIETLANQATYDSSTDLPGQIKTVALEYGLMSNYTAFIAVDSSHQTTGDHGLTVAVPVPVPYGVRYDTTVQN